MFPPSSRREIQQRALRPAGDLHRRYRRFAEAIDQANDSEYDARPEDGPRRGKNSGLGKEDLEATLEHFTHKKTLILNMQ